VTNRLWSIEKRSRQPAIIMRGLWLARSWSDGCSNVHRTGRDPGAGHYGRDTPRHVSQINNLTATIARSVITFDWKIGHIARNLP
jgi:hypothetical protein